LIDPRLILGITAAGSSFLVAILFLAALRRWTWRSPPLTAGLSPAAKISVIMPARDEAQDIGQSIESILAQQDVTLELIVVNDHSTDRTGAIVDAASVLDGRIRVIHNPALPPGWLGKCNAMQQASKLATGEILLFTDGDIVHQKSCMATALAELERRNLDFLSLFPRMDSISLWENIVVPTFIGGLALLAPPGIEDPRSPDALGVPPCSARSEASNRFAAKWVTTGPWLAWSNRKAIA
jgi:cellulose synthase/poly-beta-1,6-N-acetylglucosamine synthase-like glycosyltransferase